MTAAWLMQCDIAELPSKLKLTKQDKYTGNYSFSEEVLQKSKLKATQVTGGYNG